MSWTQSSMCSGIASRVPCPRSATLDSVIVVCSGYALYVVRMELYVLCIKEVFFVLSPGSLARMCTQRVA